jgi:Domain of unknown function (DUF4331)
VFSELEAGGRTATVYCATGPVRLFIGVRSDPFFAHADGSFHGFKWTGQDAFADRNIQSIALEVPNDMLGSESAIGVCRPWPIAPSRW